MRQHTLLHLLLSAGPALAAPAGSAHIESMGEAQLKERYLVCARQASLQRMGAADAALCSQVADTLLRKSFGGDLDRQLAWWRQHRDKAEGPARHSTPRP